MKTTPVTLLLFLWLMTGAAADTFVVTNSSDPSDGSCDSDCTLREAIMAANANPGPDIIEFNILGTGVKTMVPLSALPTITETVIIDGYTQPGASENTLEEGDDAVLLIQLNGMSAGSVVGLDLHADNCVVRGLVINRFEVSGIFMFSGTGNVIEGNFIGTDAAGTADLGNGGSAGVFLSAENGALIGGPLPAARNLISGNDGDGILFYFGSSGEYRSGQLHRDGPHWLGRLAQRSLWRFNPGRLFGQFRWRPDGGRGEFDLGQRR